MDRDRAADGRGHARCGSAWRSVGRAHGETRPTRFLVESAGDVIPAGVLRRGVALAVDLVLVAVLERIGWALAAGLAALGRASTSSPRPSA